jgi:hypothetical protein
MNLYDSILASQPLTAFKLNGAGTGYTDITNRAVSFTPTTSLAFNSPIIAGNVTKSLDAKNASAATFNKGGVYKKGSERNSWSLEAWVAPRNIASGRLDIISNAITTASPQDGLSVDSDFIHFRVEFNTSAIDLSWSMPDALEGWHVVGTYTPGKMTLYINGEAVASASVTDAQILDGFKQADTTFNVGRSSGTIAATVDGIAIYGRALSDAEVYLHFKAGRRVAPAGYIAGVFGGNSFDGTHRDILDQKTWSSKADWFTGVYTDIEFEDGTLGPVEDPTNQTSLAGVWTGMFQIGTSLANIYGIDVDWDGIGSFTVDASIDNGGSWVNLTNGNIVAGTFNWASSDNSVLIRVTFAGGIVSDTSAVERLRVIAYRNATVVGTDGSRTISVTGTQTTWPESNEPVESNSATGFSLTSGSMTLSVDAEVDVPKNVGSLEFWVKFGGTTASKYLFDARGSGGTEFLWSNASGQLAFPSGTLYVNGTSYATTAFVPVADTWYHVVYVFATPANRVMTLGAGGVEQFAIINVYPNQLTATEVALAYLMYSGYPTASLGSDSNPITEVATPFKMYAYDWSISPTG